MRICIMYMHTYIYIKIVINNYIINKNINKRNSAHLQKYVTLDKHRYS